MFSSCVSLLLHTLSSTQLTSSPVARSSSKLRKLLEEEHKVPSNVIDANLSIIQGSVKDIIPVKQTLAPTSIAASSTTGVTTRQPAQIVLAGVGGKPFFQCSLTTPVSLDDPTVCQEGMTTILRALRELRREAVIAETQRPLLIAISTTGVSQKRDVPIALTGVYHWMLRVPHEDKMVMERELARASTETGPDAPIVGFVIVRPTLLLDGDMLGMDKIRVGWEIHPEAVNANEMGAPGPAMGYSIRRADVGLWIFEGVVRNGGNWMNKCVTLTY
jgi:hypothetical protein